MSTNGPTTQNDIAARLGEVGLPEPVADLASRRWDAVVVGGGHNGLTAAAYLARAGQSVLVLERRERLGGACTLERPFADEGFVVSPCAYVVGLLDEVVIRELELERRGLRYWMADPNLWVPAIGHTRSFSTKCAAAFERASGTPGWATRQPAPRSRSSWAAIGR
jgi:choline dehydrogenase-like flavoprotein